MNTLRNNVKLIGNLGTDPETISFGEGKIKVNLNLATNESYTDKAGEKIERTQWHNVVLFGKTAEIAERYLNKGNEVAIEGRLNTRSYEKDGQVRYITEVIGNELLMLGKRA